MSTHFIEVDDGWVNASHVARIELQKCKNPGLLFYSADKSVIGKKTCHSGFDPSDIAPIVPAAPGSTAVIISASNGNDRPSEALSWTYPIVGWRISEGAGTPILTDQITSDDHVLIQSKDGSLIGKEGAVFANIAEARDHVLRLAQQSWDQRKQIRRVA